MVDVAAHAPETLARPRQTFYLFARRMAARAVLSPRDATERNPYSARFKLSAVRAALARPVWRRIVPTCREFGISSLDLLRDWIKDRDEIESLAILEEIVDTVAESVAL
ncbi:hypothetical protein EMIHUDRAFT_215479 [Emiliania huxleyi CCMP1516]|uniref:Uncharacterized protein n=2 Tax=Emiliania huxleyi TaxID=2903 RepID=A0A0D3IHF4_EMIH1|nr:hypothetical protein EMIHUDRAFT_215479 [Emiliania huxleyi CCMP1516]EOD10689.1 hypothetical protein EMIHUDRAFT_215479 [Emiliania huxleyi CCMP1516]|eukprot:XP_005763118.1 hypothetical protein EMIHUDRAFT_215479 [Emiliania huxleyi CCMP1516]